MSENLYYAAMAALLALFVVVSVVSYPSEPKKPLTTESAEKKQDEKAEKDGNCVGYCMGPRIGFDGKIHLLPGFGFGL